MTFIEIISAARSVYRLWANGTFFKIANFFKEKRKTGVNKKLIDILQQRQLFTMAHKIQWFFIMKRRAFFIDKNEWITLLNGLQFTIINGRELDSNHIHYLNVKLPVYPYGQGLEGLLDGIGKLTIEFPDEGRLVNADELELIMRNYMLCLRPEVTRYTSAELGKISNHLRYFHMMSLQNQ